MAPKIKKLDEVDKIRKASMMAMEAISFLEKEIVREGVCLEELDKKADEFIRFNGACPSFKGLYGFPNSICTSLNDVIIHGLPDKTVLKNGDILGIDIGVKKDGWFGDVAVTIGVGEISKQDKKLIECSQDTLNFAIDSIYDGMRIKELSYLMQKFIRERGFEPLRGFCGHGIGSKPHEDPEIPNYIDTLNLKAGQKFKNGMVFCLEPMVCQEDGNYKILDDGWSVVSASRLRGSHHEHTIALIDNKASVLSLGNDICRKNFYG